MMMNNNQDNDFEFAQNLEDGLPQASEGDSQINDLRSLWESLEGQDKSLVGETALLWLSPDVIEEEDGFNLRDYDRPDTVAHIQALKDAWKNGTQLPPLEVKIDNGRCFVRDGHCRLRAARLAIAEGAPIKRIPLIELTGSAEASSLRILTSNQQLKLTLMQRAHGYSRLRELGWSDQKIAKHICKTDTHVRETIRLLTLPERLQALINLDVISPDMATKMFNRYGEKAVDIINEAYEKQKKAQEALLDQDPSTVAPIKVSTKHISVPAPKITKKMVSSMSLSVRSMHDAFESKATINTESGEVDLKLPIEMYEQFMAMAKALKEVSETPSSTPDSPASQPAEQSKANKPKADVVDIGAARKVG
ncbi:TPA: ParB/RepB/Spo0J family partition protein [Pseudomonas aeruginosa]